MATYSALPDTLDITFVKGDALEVPLSFSQNLTGYTLTPRIVKVLTVSGGEVTSSLDVMGFTTTAVNLSSGQFKISLSEVESNALELGTPYRWSLKWTPSGGKARTVMSGSVQVKSP